MARRPRLRIRFLSDVIRTLNEPLYRVVNNDVGQPLFKIVPAILQKLLRDALNSLADRWQRGKGCRPLTKHNVRVRDGQAFLPREGSSHDCLDHRAVFLQLLRSVFGPKYGTFEDPSYAADASVYARDDLYTKLAQPISLEQFRNLFFHPFFQTEEELADFPADLIENLRNLPFSHNGREEAWTSAYRRWDGLNPRDPGQAIDMQAAISKNLMFLSTFQHRMYMDTAVDEAELVRNTKVHYNQNAKKLRPRHRYVHTKREIGAVTYDLFPFCTFRLYNFCWDTGVNFDFTLSRTCYSI